MKRSSLWILTCLSVLFLLAAGQAVKSPRLALAAERVEAADFVVYLPFMPVVPAPPAPELQPIENADGDGSYTVAWSAVAGATAYDLQQATDPAFDDAVNILVANVLSWQAAARPAGVYYYRVRTVTAAGAGGWSEPQSTAVISNEPPVLNPIANPENSSSYNVTWSANPTAAAYVLEESASGDFKDPVVLYQGPETSFHALYRPAGQHAYRVKAVLLNGMETGWSNVVTTAVDATVHLVSAAGFYTQDDQVVVVGELHNTLATGVTNLQVSITLFDGQGNAIAGATRPALIDYVLPNMTTPFKLTFDHAPDVAYYELEVSGAVTNLTPYVLQITQQDTYLDDQSAYHVTGQVLNPYEQSVDSAEAYVTLYDREHTVIGVNSGPTDPSQLAEEGTAGLDIAVRDYNGMPDASLIADHLLQVVDDNPVYVSATGQADGGELEFIRLEHSLAP